jgi:hypothetical protein
MSDQNVSHLPISPRFFVCINAQSPFSGSGARVVVVATVLRMLLDAFSHMMAA